MPTVEAYAAKVVAGNVRHEALERIAADKAAGYTLVIASASYRPLCRADRPAARLRCRHRHRPFHPGHRLCPRQDRRRELLPTMRKLRHDRGLAGRTGVDRAGVHVRAYSDHVSDAPLLDYADEGFAANPHEPLAKPGCR